MTRTAPFISEQVLDSFSKSPNTSLEVVILVSEVKRLRNALKEIKKSINLSVEQKNLIYETQREKYGEGSPEELQAHRDLHTVANALQKVYVLSDVALTPKKP